jgi:membrane protein implicated in regulation of membrane protease activity
VSFFPPARTPKRPFRDSAIFYAVLAGAVVGVALVTGASILRAVIVAVSFFVIATAYSWWRFRQQLEKESSP